MYFIITIYSLYETIYLFSFVRISDNECLIVKKERPIIKPSLGCVGEATLACKNAKKKK